MPRTIIGVLLLLAIINSILLAQTLFFSPPKSTDQQKYTPPKKVLSMQTVSTPSPSPLPTSIPSQVHKRQMVRLGIVVDDYANRTGELSSLSQLLGVHFSTVSIFKQFGLPGNSRLSLEDVSYIKSLGSTLLIAWEPWNPQEGMHQSVDYLAEIGEGKQDAYIKEFAQQVKAYAAPVTIRFGHEMNGTWYPWAQRPQAYSTAYRRIVELFRNEGVPNISWMWSVSASPASTIAQYYPGSAYVDSIGLDGFNQGTTQPQSTWVSFAQVFRPAYQAVLPYNKPIIISETASAEQGGSKADWIRDMFNTLATTMPAVRECIWFSLNKEADWRVNSSPSSLSAFQAAQNNL